MAARPATRKQGRTPAGRRGAISRAGRAASSFARRLADQARPDVTGWEQTITDLRAQVDALKAEAPAASGAVNDRRVRALDKTHETRVTRRNSDILFEAFGVALLPHWRVEANEVEVKTAAYPQGHS